MDLLEVPLSPVFSTQGAGKQPLVGGKTLLLETEAQRGQVWGGLGGWGDFGCRVWGFRVPGFGSREGLGFI